MDNRVETLQEKHNALKAMISRELARPRPDECKLKKLKIEKLHLKDRIARIAQ